MKGHENKKKKPFGRFQSQQQGLVTIQVNVLSMYKHPGKYTINVI